MDNFLNTPWLESPLTEKLLCSAELTDAERALCRAFSELGYVVLTDLSLEAEFIERIKADTQRFLQGSHRLKDAWKESSAIKALTLHPQIIDTLKLLYRRQPIAFQTLNFEYAKRQPLHADTFEFHTLPNRFLCSVWVALEDFTPAGGLPEVFPGSHKFPVLDYEDLGVSCTNPRENVYPLYEQAMQKLLVDCGLTPQTLAVKKGDVIIKAANLLHRSAAQTQHTRFSQLSHYFFEDCVYYNPLLSTPKLGEYSLKQVTDIRTGDLVASKLNGQVLEIEAIPHTDRSRLRYQEESTRLASIEARTKPKRSFFSGLSWSS